MWGNPTLLAPGQKYLPKNNLSESSVQPWRYGAVEVEDVNCAVFIIYAKTSFSVGPLTSKVAIYRDSLTSTIFK